MAEGAHTSLRGLEVHEDSGTANTVFNKTETINHISGVLPLGFKSLQPGNLALKCVNVSAILNAPIISSTKSAVLFAGGWRITRRED